MEEIIRFIIKLQGINNTFCLTAYLNAKTSENNSERSNTKAEPIAPSLPTKRKTRQSVFLMLKKQKMNYVLSVYIV